MFCISFVNFLGRFYSLSNPPLETTHVILFFHYILLMLSQTCHFLGSCQMHTNMHYPSMKMTMLKSKMCTLPQCSLISSWQCYHLPLQKLEFKAEFLKSDVQVSANTHKHFFVHSDIIYIPKMCLNIFQHISYSVTENKKVYEQLSLFSHRNLKKFKIIKRFERF